VERGGDFLEARRNSLRGTRSQTEWIRGCKDLQCGCFTPEPGLAGPESPYSIYALLPYAAFPSIMWLAKDDLLMLIPHQDSPHS
jgi:hypothetical protein